MSAGVRAQRVPVIIEQAHDGGNRFMHAEVSQQLSLRSQAVRPDGKEGVPSNELLPTFKLVNAVSALISRLPVNALSCKCSSRSDVGNAGAGPTNPDCSRCRSINLVMADKFGTVPVNELPNV